MLAFLRKIYQYCPRNVGSILAILDQGPFYSKYGDFVITILLNVTLCELQGSRIPSKYFFGEKNRNPETL
jgi:hypothetical protein